jgi:hypothetical protein
MIAHEQDYANTELRHTIRTVRSTARETMFLALSYVGYQEGRNNWNDFATRVDGGRWQNQPWCGVYVKDMLDRSGVTGEPSPVYTPSGVAGYKRVGRWIPRDGACREGDVVFFDWGGSQSTGATDHVGFCLGQSRNGYIDTVEGNTQPGTSGDQSNGGGVYRRRRPLTSVVGFGRPLYATVANPGPMPGPTPPLSGQEDEEMRIVDFPDGSVWLCSGVWRTKIEAKDAGALAFIGVPRTAATPDFASLIERTLVDAHGTRLAAWWSTRIAQHLKLT